MPWPTAACTPSWSTRTSSTTSSRSSSKAGWPKLKGGMPDKQDITVTVNGTRYTGSAEPRRSLVDFLRQDLGLTGTHVGCEHGVCGACTILMDGQSVRSCLMFAVQADGAELTT